jgi:hypothetical protein
MAFGFFGFMGTVTIISTIRKGPRSKDSEFEVRIRVVFFIFFNNSTR